jgi:hypothetical protein
VVLDGSDPAPLPVAFRCLGLNLVPAVFTAIWVVASIGVTGSPSSVGTDRIFGAAFAILGAWVLVVLLRMEVRASESGVTLRRVRTRFVPWKQLGEVKVVRGMWFDAVRLHIANRRLSFWMPVGGLTMSGVNLFWGMNADDDSRSMRLAHVLDQHRQVKQSDAP